MSLPTYDQFVTTEMPLIRARYVQTFGHEPSASDYAHQAWRRLVEQWSLADLLAHIPGDDPEPDPGPDPGPAPPVELTRWRGVITMPVAGMPTPDPQGGLLFTAQGYSSTFTVEQRRQARDAYKAEGYTHWLTGPIYQQSYHGQYPGNDDFGHDGQFLARTDELRADGIEPVLVLLDDQGRWASEHGGVNRDAVERDLTPLYRESKYQDRYRAVMLAWEPNWRTDDYAWACAWARRVWPHAYIVLHLPAQKGAPGQHSDFVKNGGAYATEADMWNTVLPHIDAYGIQLTFDFDGSAVQHNRTNEQQFVYDLLDKSRRFRYGHGGAAPRSGPEVAMWQANWGDDHKDYWAWDGAYLTTSANGGPCHLIAMEYSSYWTKSDPSHYDPKAKDWGALALTVPGVTGFGDGGRG